MGSWGAAGLACDGKALIKGDSQLQRPKLGHIAQSPIGLKNGID